MSDRATLVLAMLLVMLSVVPQRAQAGEPTDQLRNRIDRLYRVTTTASESRTADAEAVKILDEMFNWPRMAESGLKQHWQSLTDAQRTEFTRLFAGLFRRTYLSQMRVVDGGRFEYLGDAIHDDRATVLTRIATKPGNTLTVSYAVGRDPAGQWRVDDVRVDQVSLMDNYRVQFEAVISHSSYEALIAKLLEMVR